MVIITHSSRHVIELVSRVLDELISIDSGIVPASEIVVRGTGCAEINSGIKIHTHQDKLSCTTVNTILRSTLLWEESFELFTLFFEPSKHLGTSSIGGFIRRNVHRHRSTIEHIEHEIIVDSTNHTHLSTLTKRLLIGEPFCSVEEVVAEGDIEIETIVDTSNERVGFRPCHGEDISYTGIG